MRFNIRKALVALLVVSFGILIACGGSSKSASTPTPVAQLVLSPAALTYSATVGDAPYAVSITAHKGNPVEADTFTVTSSNPAVASVTISGSVAFIAPLSAGTANIVITSGAGLTRTIAATIAADQTQLTLSPAALTYKAIAGSTPYSVTVTATKSDGVTAGTFTVSSSNTAVATASASGNAVTITPVAAGTANIVFTSGSNAKVTRTIVATIAPDQTAISLSPAALTYAAKAGDSPYVVTVAAVKSDGATADTFTVSSSNSSVVNASASGNAVTITPVAAGTANIVFTSGSNAKVTRAIAATISAATNSPQLSLSPAALTYTASAGSPAYNVTVTAIKNDGVTEDTFTVVSSDPTVASTSVSGKVATITPLKAGTANIVFTTGTGLTTTIVATISPNQGQLSLSPAALTYTAVAGSTPYTVTVTAIKSDGVTPDSFTVVSSNTAVATTSVSGNVVTITPVAAGTANIVFTSGSNANLTSTIVATITAPSVSGCDGTEWFCDDFQEETIADGASSSAVSTVTNWDLTPFGSNAQYYVAYDPNVPANKVLYYWAGTNSLDIVDPGKKVALIKQSVWDNIPNKADYYFEARIKPQDNSKTAKKTIYMIGRYQDDADWYFGGMNLQSTSRVAAGYAKGLSASPLVLPTEVSKTDPYPLTLAAKASSATPPADGQWYDLRYELVGSTQTLYVNGVQVASVNDAAFASGKVGLYTYNRNFLIDDIRVGAVQLVLSPNAPTYSAVAGNAPYVVNVTAVKPDGVTPDTFTAVSSNTSVVSTSISGNVVTITPVGAGTANIVFTSDPNHKVTRTIAATITAPVATNPTLTLSPSALGYTALAGSAPYNVTVTATKADGITADSFTATSSNPAVATTSVSGNVVAVTPLAPGTANIVINTGSNLTATIVATITTNPTLTLSPSALSYTATVGDAPYTVQVSAIKNDGVTADTFTAKSSNTAAATTSVTGNTVSITPVAAGTANITISTGSNVTATIVATIKANLAQITFTPPALSYTAVLGSAPYSVTVAAVKSDGVTPDTFTVVSGTPSVATVAQTANNVAITPVAVGTSNIVFTSASGVTSTIVATISTDLTQLTLSPSASTYTAPAGSDPYIVSVTALKSDGTTADTFTVSSDTPAVATAVASGNQVTITPVSVGTANIVFTSSSKASVTSTIAITVTPNLAQINLSPSSLSYSAAANSAPYAVTVTAVKPDGTSADTFSYTITPSDSSVVTASQTGNVITITPVAAGSASITFTGGSGATTTLAITITAPNYSGCDGTEWFCDDFQSGNSNNWTLTPGTGTFAVVPDINVPGNQVLQYTAGSTTGGLIALLTDGVWTANVTPHFVGSQADYYVEARIKPQINSTTGNKYLYMIGRYQSATNWYLGGLNVQSTPNSSRAEAGYMKAGTINRSVQQGNTPSGIIMGTQGGTPTGTPGTDGQWYTVRLEMIGGVETLYMDGAKMGSLSDATWNTGKIGLYTANKSFLIDDIRVGDPSVKPVQLTIAPSALAYSAEAADAPYVVTVTAVKNDGVTADTFTATSSDQTIVSVSINGNIVTLRPLAAGTANIVFTSGSNPKLTRTIVASIAPQFVQPTSTYSLNGNTVPAAGETSAYIDQKLMLTFDSVPTLGTAGSIRIFKTSDDSLVDVIKMTGETDTIGQGFLTGTAYYRGVNTTPVWVSGNTVFIAPHLSKLAYNTSYYVAIANGAITGTLAGQTFTGIGKVGNWWFTTQAAPATGLTTLSVGATGTSANFRSVQGALNYVMKYVATTTPATINVADGTYQELLFLRGNNNVTINGQSAAGTIIQYNNYESLNSGSGASATGTPTSGGGRAIFLVESSDLLTLSNLTLKNTHLRSQPGSGQAETIYFNNDAGRLIAKYAEFDSEQDTLQLTGYSWFYNTVVAGNVDFIWGANRVSLFENSEIRTVGDSSAGTKSVGGYLMQARTKTAADKGFVFLNSKLTFGTGPGGNSVATGSDAATYLARAAAGTWFDNAVYVSCNMDTHIATVGWAANIAGNPAPNPATATATSGWREFGSMDMQGNLLNVTGRVAVNSYQMTPTDITNNYDTRAHIFSAFGSGAGWNPLP